MELSSLAEFFNQLQHRGEIAGLGAAAVWAIGSVIFSRLPVPAAALNLWGQLGDNK